MDIPLVEQTKIQAQVLVPLLKALQAELGEERANTIIQKALGEHFRKFGQKWWRALGHGNLGEKMDTAMKVFSSGNALDYEVIKQASDAYEVNITGCRYAQFYKELGEPELGFLFVCSQDFPLTEGFSPNIQLTRTQTIMQGASHCDFRWELKKEQEEKQK
jgi:hypothetical protein